MHKLLVTIAILVSHRAASGIKNSAGEVTSGPTGLSDETAGPVRQAEEQVGFGDKYIPGHNRDDRITRPDRNFIITHEGILQYQPVSRSLHNLDQDYKASSTFTRSEVIPVPANAGHGPSGRALSDNSLAVSADLSHRDTQASYTSRDALSVPLHVGFQVEDPSPLSSSVGPLRMNPKGKVLSLDADLNVAPSNQYRRRAVARQPFSGGKQPMSQTPQSFQASDMSLAETSYVPSLVYGQKAAPDSATRNTLLTSISYHPSTHQMDQAFAASNHYYAAVQPDQKHLNSHFTRSNDLDMGASDTRPTYEEVQNGFLQIGNSGGIAGGRDNHRQKMSAKDQSLDETKVYGDLQSGGAKSYVDYMTAGDLETKKYLSGRYTGDVEEAGSEGTVPIHFGFQVEHPRIQYPPKSSFADKYHSDHHIPSKTGKVRIPKVPKTAKYVPSVEDVDDDIESDFKHIKVKKYSTNNEELSIPSNYHARYTDEVPNQSGYNFKYSNSASNMDPQQSTELLRSAATNERQQHLTSQQQRHSMHQHMSQKPSQHLNQGQLVQASQKYYQYVKPQEMARRIGTVGHHA